MKKKQKRTIAIIITLMIVIALTAACTRGEDDADPPDGQITENDAAGDAVDLSDPSNTLRFGAKSLEGFFVPPLASDINDKYVVSLIFEGLVTNDASGLFIPNIATWEISNDNLTYTFKLNDNVRFSDGTPMTAYDVAFTYRTFAHPKYSGNNAYVVAYLEGYSDYSAGNTGDFEGIRVIDEKTIAFTFTQGTASPANIAYFDVGIMPEHYYAFNDWDDFVAMARQPLGSGWFVFEEFRASLILRKNLNYWNPENAPLINGIEFFNVTDEVIIDAFFYGELDLASPSTNVNIYNELNDMDNVNISIVAGSSYNFMQFNTLVPQLADFRVRQALLYALDREAFVEALYGPFGSVGMSPISPASWAYNPSGLNDYAFDLVKANELMDDAGWVMGADGVRARGENRMEITWLVYPEAAWQGTLSDLAAETWPQIGVDLTIEVVDYNSIGERTLRAASNSARDFDIYSMVWNMDVDPDITGGIFGLDYGALSDGGYNASGFASEEFRSKVEEAAQSFDTARRIELYNEISSWYNQQVPTVVVALRSDFWVNDTRVQNLEISTFADWTYSVNKITLD